MTFFIMLKIDARNLANAVYAAESLIDVANDWPADLAVPISLNVQPVEER